MAIEFTKKGFFEGVIGSILICFGMWLLLWTYTALQNVSFAGNIWNRRIYTFMALGLVSMGFGMAWNGTLKKIIWTCITFGILTALLLLMGGIFSFDALNPNYNAYWVAFDTGWTDVGLGVKLISDAVKNIVPIALLCLIIYQVVYAGEADESMKGILEGVVCLGFIIAFNVFGNITL